MSMIVRCQTLNKNILINKDTTKIKLYGEKKIFTFYFANLWPKQNCMGSKNRETHLLSALLLAYDPCMT